MVIFRRRVAGLSDAALSRFVSRATRAAGLRGAVNVLVTGSRELRALNSRFRGQDQATDVLSFPPFFSDGFAGDMAISAEIAARNAKRLGHSAAEEIKILALHGILHLAGYDHERDSGQMAQKEVRLQRSLGLAEGLIERNGQKKIPDRGKGSERTGRAGRKVEAVDPQRRGGTGRSARATRT